MYCRLFTNFIAHGDPTPEPTDDIPKWPTYNTDDQYYMKIDSPLEVKQDYTSNWRLGMPGHEFEPEPTTAAPRF